MQGSVITRRGFLGASVAFAALAERSVSAEPVPLTAIIMEATNGDLDEDFRMFVHSGVQLVSRTVNMLKKTGRYKPPAGQKAYLTHLAIKYRDWPAEKINAELPDSLAAAYDGLELTLG